MQGIAGDGGYNMNNCEIHDEYCRLIFENSFDAILLTSPDGGVHHANAAACQIFQMTEEEICQQGRAGLVDPTDERVSTALIEREKNGKVKAELNLVRRDGSVFPAEITSTLFTDSAGIIWSAMIIRDISVFKKAVEALQKAQEDSNRYATADFLTGLINRRVLMDKLEIEMTRTNREDSTLSILMLDIDAFKSINDTLGHAAGDFVLQCFANLLFKKLRPYDFVGRYGGDEFLICLPNTDYTIAITIAERICHYIEGQKHKYGEHLIPITTSIGVSTYSAGDSKSIHDLISAVDKNLYIAKVKRNCVYGVDSAR